MRWWPPSWGMPCQRKSHPSRAGWRQRWMAGVMAGRMSPPMRATRYEPLSDWSAIVSAAPRSVHCSPPGWRSAHHRADPPLTLTQGHAGWVDDDVLTRALRAAVRGEVAADAGSRALYATDASTYRVPPRAVVLPACADDVRAVMAICCEQGVSLTARGAGTSIAGNAIGPGVILDFSRHLDAVLELDPVARLAR